MRWEVPKMWPGETVILLGSGPSMRHFQYDLLKGYHVIAINYRYRDHPAADICYFTDYNPFYLDVVKNYEFRRFKGRKVTIAAQLLDDPDVCVLQQGEERGLSLDPAVLNFGANSGYAALNLAVHLGCSRILLLGYDMQSAGARVHCDSYHKYGPYPETFAIWLKAFPTMVPTLDALGIVVVNCTPGSALHCFPQMSLQEALCS